MVTADAQLVLEVRDDGVGLPDGDSIGSGLRNMQKRADALGGSLTISGQPGHGTTMHWAVPLPI